MFYYSLRVMLRGGVKHFRPFIENVKGWFPVSSVFITNSLFTQSNTFMRLMPTHSGRLNQKNFREY